MSWSYSEAEVQAWYAEKFQNWTWGLVADENNTIVGFVAVSGTHLDQLFVDPQYQNGGIGTHMLTQALGTPARIRTLIVFEQNIRARVFYERHGFREMRRFLSEDDEAVAIEYALEHG